MGIFSSLFVKKGSSFSPKDNFEFIAMNVAQINYVLRSHFEERFLDDDQIFIATGALDVIAYLTEGTITSENIKHALFHAKQGKCRIGFVEELHEEGATETGLFIGVNTVKDLLLNFTLQIECLIFYADSDVPAQDVIASVLSKKAAIAQALQESAASAESGHLTQGLEELIRSFLSEAEFADLRNQIGID